MAIKGIEKRAVEEVMRAYVRPSDPIDSYEHLVGRAKQRDSIEEAINLAGYARIRSWKRAGPFPLASKSALLTTAECVGAFSSGSR